MVFIGIIVVVLLFVIIEFNRLVRLRNKVKQAKSSIDVYLTQRFDLIPNLVSCVKSYANYEEKTLTEVVALRAKYMEQKDIKIGSELNNQFLDLMAVGEAMPDLKANTLFLDLQKNLARMESQLQAARRVYNGDVTIYNTFIDSFPNNMFASLFGFKKEDLFVVTEEAAKENIRVEL